MKWYHLFWQFDQKAISWWSLETVNKTFSSKTYVLQETFSRILSLHRFDYISPIHFNMHHTIYHKLKWTLWIYRTVLSNNHHDLISNQSGINWAMSWKTSGIWTFDRIRDLYIERRIYLIHWMELIILRYMIFSRQFLTGDGWTEVIYWHLIIIK